MAQNKLPKLQIAYACNDKVYNGLYLSILSIVKRTKNPIDFYLFSASLPEMKSNYKSLSKKHENSIKKMIKKYSKDSTFTILDCKNYFFKRANGQLPNTRHWTPYTTFRLLFDMFKQIKGLILYLDTDTMVCDNIAKAFDVDIANYEACVTSEIFAWDEKLRGKYFNAGVILMNIDMIRKTKYFEKAFKYLQVKQPKMCDQDALNATASKLKFRSDDRFNRVWRKRLNTTVIKHFAGPVPKPWRLSFKRYYKSLNYGVWKEDIAEWRAMRRK